MPRNDMKVKICGITNFDDALAAVQAGASYLGFINYLKSPRHIDLEKAAEIIAQIKKQFPNIRFALVTVNADSEMLKQAAGKYSFDILQLHGEETPEMCAGFKGSAEVWKAVIIKEPGDVAKANMYRGSADKILFDGGKGSGKRIPLQWLAGQKIDVLGGGLGPDVDIGELLDINPEIIDINSAVESSPGKKDHTKMKLTIQTYVKTNIH